MAVEIAVFSDTHCASWEEVHPAIREAAATADVAVHCGDLTRMAVAEGMRRDAKRAVVVHGNSDPVEARRALPYVETFQAEGVRVGVTHPAWGGPEFDLEELLPDFPEPVDAILFGHLHETIDETRAGVRFINPGQGYASFAVPASMALVTVRERSISVEIRVVESAL